MSSEPQEEREAELAAREAARIGGGSGRPPTNAAEASVDEAGGGEAEGFEQTEGLLVEHASHGDSQPAHTVSHDQPPAEEDDERADGEADRERSSETEAENPS